MTADSQDADLAVVQHQWKRRSDLMYQTELSSLYHRKRERFFDLCDRFAKAVAIIGGSAAISRVADGPVLMVIAALIAATSAFSLVFSFSERARKHSELAREFCELGAKIAREGETDFSEKHLAEWDAAIRMLEAAEPATLGALVLLCQNQLAGSRMGATTYPLVWFKRFTADFIDWDVRDELSKGVPNPA